MIPTEHCPVCEGDGYIEDHVLCQTYPCFLCRPTKEWQSGTTPQPWLDDVARVEAKYYGGFFSKPPDLIVIHRGVTAGNIANYFTNPRGREVSAHFYVEQNGTITQCVPLTNIAHHAKGSNFRSIGIETQGPMNSDFHEPLIDSLCAIIERVCQVYPTLDLLLGHSDLSPRRRRDPGRNFPWMRLAQLPIKSPHFGS